MRVVVCVKHVPDTNEPKRLEADLTLARTGIQSVINPMDEYALEVALKWKDADPSLEIVILTMGPDDARGTIKKCLAKGADRAVLVTDPALEGSDALGTARVLAAAIRKIGDADVVMAGIRSSDGECYLVAPMVAELLDLPQITFCKDGQLDQAARTVQMQREAEGAIEVMRAQLPALVAVTKALYEPRLASFKGITAAAKKELLAWSLADLGVPADQVGLAGATVRVQAFKEPPARPQSQVLTGPAPELASKLVSFLHEAKLV
ncbi:MAG: electron transfer flavoprotein subunit beta/FixA family protein [Candidatus Sericytochromatia bacterium]|nr:electron transfer flavoprotein subunit beta/FixA family protein [Candidatus Tanganyikabacteria bacterium]